MGLEALRSNLVCSMDSFKGVVVGGETEGLLKTSKRPKVGRSKVIGMESGVGLGGELVVVSLVTISQSSSIHSLSSLGNGHHSSSISGRLLTYIIHTNFKLGRDDVSLF